MPEPRTAKRATAVLTTKYDYERSTLRPCADPGDSIQACGPATAACPQSEAILAARSGDDIISEQHTPGIALEPHLFHVGIYL